MAVSPKLSDTSIKAPSRLLAEALRELLDASPSDNEVDDPACLVVGPLKKPVGDLKVERAYLAVFDLEATDKTVISLVAADQTGEIITREYATSRQVSIFVSVQRKLRKAHNSVGGKEELDELVDYSERVLRSCIGTVVDADGNKYVIESFVSTGRDDEALLAWGQFTEVHNIDYRVLVSGNV